MADDIKNENGRVDIPMLCFDGAVSGEVSEDFVLPDYMPEVSRILRLEYRAIPEGKYVGAGNLEFSGAVSYTVIYASGDSRICSVSLSSSYEGKCEIPSDARNLKVVTALENATCRLLGPRKLSARSKLRTRVIAFSETEHTSCVQKGMRGVEVEYLMEKDGTKGLKFFEFRDIKLEDGMENVSGKPVFCSAVISVASATAQNDAIAVNGEVLLNVMLESADSGYSSAVKRIPFERVIRADGVKRGDKCHAEGVCVSASVSAREDGALGCDCSANIDLFATASSARDVAICRDAYSASPSTTAICSAKEVELYDAGYINGNFTFSATAAMRDVNSDSGAELIDVAVYPEIASLVRAQNKVIVSGSAKVNAIMREKTENRTEESDGYFVSSGEFTAPFKYECELPLGGGDEIFVATANSRGASGKIDGDKISVECEMAVSATVISKKKKSAIEKIEVEESDAEFSGLVINYAEAGDSLWQMAKKYKVPLSKLASDNDIAVQGDADKLRAFSQGSAVFVELI